MHPSSSGAGRDLNHHIITTTPPPPQPSGLARFRSAPAASSWLDALLESDAEDNNDDDDVVDALKPHGFTHLLTSGSSTNASTSYTIPSSAHLGFPDLNTSSGGGGGSSNLSFHRQNSSPAGLFGEQGDGFFSSFGIPAIYDYLGSETQRARGSGEDKNSLRFMAHLNSEQSRNIQAGVDGLFDIEMDKLLEDSVPCRVRAKRGCATHPRSIAERVRRTRISDRIRKLQEIVPNMDKQTNTADMLDEAVEYVKHLQKQIQELTERQQKCKCGAKNAP